MTTNPNITKYLAGKITLVELQKHTKYADKEMLKFIDNIAVSVTKVLEKGYKINLTITRKEYNISEIIVNHIRLKYARHDWIGVQDIYDYIRTGVCDVCGAKMKGVDPEHFTAKCPACEVRRRAINILKVFSQVDYVCKKNISVDKLNEEQPDSFFFQLVRRVKKELKEVM